MRVPTAALLALAAAAAAVPGCKREIASTSIVYARGADSESLDPQGVDDGESAKVIENIFDGLVEFGPGSTEIVPDLAERWEAAEGGLAWTFHLRDGVKFHDGTPFDAEAVVFTYKRFLEEKGPAVPPKSPYRSFYADPIASIEAKDARTVVFRLKRPYAPFLSNLAMFCAGIVSPEAVRKHGGEGFGRNPCGTGPFRFVSWNFGEKKITLARNESYWRGPPPAEKVVFVTIPDNNARISALRAGNCNWMDGLNAEDLDACRKDATLKVWTGPAPNVGYLALNTLRKPFDDVRVRRAVSLAIDRKKIVDALYFGTGIPAVHPMPPGMLGYDASTPLPRPDREKAKALLAEAGFPQGFETVLYAMSNPRPYFPSPQKIAQVIKSDLEAIGIRASIDTVGDWPLYREAVQNAKHPMCLLGWTGDNGDPDNFLYTFFSEESAKVGKGALSTSFWVDPAMQDLLARGQAETDPAKRAAIYGEALALVQREVPMIPISHMEQVFVSKRGFEGFHVQPTGDVNLLGVRAAATQ
jgi:peptide/nickel transport system substrate-binding protein